MMDDRGVYGFYGALELSFALPGPCGGHGCSFFRKSVQIRVDPQDPRHPRHPRHPRSISGVKTCFLNTLLEQRA